MGHADGTGGAGTRRQVFSHLEDLPPALDVRVRDLDVAVEPAGPDQRGVQRLREVGRPDHNQPLGRLEAIELDQHLVQRHLHVVLVFRVTLASDGVNLVDEDDAGRVSFCGREEVPGTNTC